MRQQSARPADPARRVRPSSDLLKSPSFPTTVIFLIISCFFDLTMADVLSVSLLKKAGGWEELGGEREPTLQGGGGEDTHAHTHTPFCQTHKYPVEKEVTFNPSEASEPQHRRARLLTRLSPGPRVGAHAHSQQDQKAAGLACGGRQRRRGLSKPVCVCAPAAAASPVINELR